MNELKLCRLLSRGMLILVLPYNVSPHEGTTTTAAKEHQRAGHDMLTAAQQPAPPPPPPIMPSHPASTANGGRQVFTDEELSEIFQIDFAEIFGSPDEGLKPSSYKRPQKQPDVAAAAATAHNSRPATADTISSSLIQHKGFELDSVLMRGVFFFRFLI